MTIVRAGGSPEEDGAGAVLFPIYVEVDGPAVDPTDVYRDQRTRAGAATRVLDSARDVFADGVELARSAAARFAAGMADLPGAVRRPAEIELQLAIKFDTELGAVLAKATTGAQLQVTIRWDMREES